MAVGEPVIAGSDMLLYYTGRRVPADGKFGAIGAVRVRRDRFAGLTHGSAFSYGAAGGGTGSGAGELLTTPVQVGGPVLYVNARTHYGYQRETGDRERGTITAALIDDQERPLPGFGLADADPFRGDAVRQRMTWRGRGDLTSLVGSRVRLLFRINRSVIYAYGFGEPEEGEAVS